MCCDGDKCPDSVVFLADRKDFLSPKWIEDDFIFSLLWMNGFLELCLWIFRMMRDEFKHKGIEPG